MQIISHRHGSVSAAVADSRTCYNSEGCPAFFTNLNFPVILRFQGHEDRSDELLATDSEQIAMENRNARFWDDWWKVRLARGVSDRFPCLESPIGSDPRSLYWLVNSSELLARVMQEQGLRSILCAGNGTSQEPRALAAAGFDVTALDISPVAIACSKDFEADSSSLAYFCDPELYRPRGSVEFVVGDLLTLRYAQVCSTS